MGRKTDLRRGLGRNSVQKAAPLTERAENCSKDLFKDGEGEATTPVDLTQEEKSILWRNQRPRSRR